MSKKIFHRNQLHEKIRPTTGGFFVLLMSSFYFTANPLPDWLILNHQAMGKGCFGYFLYLQVRNYHLFGSEL